MMHNGYIPIPAKYKLYKVNYSGGIFDCIYIDAKNKSWARKIAKGELNSHCKITSIEEVV